MTEKIKLLAYMDSASVSTGYGVISKNVLKYLYNTEKYDIDQLAINYPARFNMIDEIPWTQLPAKSLNPSDPYGKTLFLRTISENSYDIVWIMNDTYVVYDLVKDLKQIIDRKRTAGKKIPKVVFYYPVDCHCKKEAGAMIEYADVPVCYNDYGRAETALEMPNVLGKLQQIPHGIDTSTFFQCPEESRQALKSKFLGKNANKFMFLNVNRNSDRKQLARCIYAFSEFRKQMPNSLLAIHAQPIERTMNRSIDLLVVLKELKLSPEEDVLFPKHYEPGRSYPDNIMNELYNAADCFITTDLGEGWGIGQTEAMAAGTPVISPNNTSRGQIFGENSERGYLYPMKDYLFIENSGLRPFGYTEDVVLEMFKVFRAGGKYSNPKAKLALEWAKEHSWENICPKWDTLFRELLKEQDIEINTIDNVEVIKI